MKHCAAAAIVLLCSSAVGFAQQDLADSPATKEDVQRYLEVMHSREMMTKMIDAMMKPMHQMMHEKYMKDKDKLPADFEARMNKMMEENLKSFPWEEMLDSMIPVYQKHLTKGDVNAIVAFYSAPTGQKLIREMPAMVGEAMQTMMPLMRKHLDAMSEYMQQQVAQMMKETESKPGQKPQARQN